jgi:hypothetical protein
MLKNNEQSTITSAIPVPQLRSRLHKQRHLSADAGFLGYISNGNFQGNRAEPDDTVVRGFFGNICFDLFRLYIPKFCPFNTVICVEPFF